MNINATLFAQLIVFFVLAVFTMKYVWPPLIKAIDERRHKIADGLAAADKAKADLTQAELRVQEELGKAREAAGDVRLTAEKQATSSIEEARAEAAKIIAQARESAQAEAAVAAQRARDELREEVAALAIKGAEQILRREVDAKAHADLLTNLKNEL